MKKGTLTPAEKSGISRHIRHLDELWGLYASEGNLEKVIDMYSKQGTLVWPDFEPKTGSAAIRKAWTEMIGKAPKKGVPRPKLKFSPKKITISSSGDIATDFGVVEMTMPYLKTIKAKYVVTWQNENGSWKVLYDVWNYNNFTDSLVDQSVEISPDMVTNPSLEATFTHLAKTFAKLAPKLHHNTSPKSSKKLKAVGKAPKTKTK